MTLDNNIRTKYVIEKQSIEQISLDLDVSEEYIRKLLVNIMTVKRSGGEAAMLSVLHDIYPLYKIDEQIYIDGLFLDFYIPNIRLGIEVDGIQHVEFVPHFFGSGASGIRKYEKSKTRDNEKEKYLHNNNIYLIRISHKEKIETENIRRIINENSKSIMDNLAKYNSTIRL